MSGKWRCDGSRFIGNEYPIPEDRGRIFLVRPPACKLLELTRREQEQFIAARLNAADEMEACLRESMIYLQSCGDDELLKRIDAVLGADKPKENDNV